MGFDAMLFVELENQVEVFRKMATEYEDLRVDVMKLLVSL